VAIRFHAYRLGPRGAQRRPVESTARIGELPVRHIGWGGPRRSRVWTASWPP